MIRDLLAGWAELDAAYPDYREAETYYEGRPEEVFATNARIANLLREGGERYRFNFVKTPVNVLASRVELTGITVPNSEPLTEQLNAVLDANDMEIYFPDLVRKTFEYGDAYLMVWPLEDDRRPSTDGSLADAALEAAGVEITLHTPKNVRMMYDPETERRKAYVIRRWRVASTVPGEKTWRVDLYYPDRVEQWVSVSGADLKTEAGWREHTADDDEESFIVNESGEIPWFHFRTEIPYGRPVHIDGYGCQDAINKLLITELTTVDSHGWPQRYGLIDPAAELDSANHGPNWESDDDADETDQSRGADSSNLRGGPGTMMTLNGMKAVGQFEAADPSVFLSPAESFIRMMAQITETPFHAFDPSGGTPSGESLKVAEAPLTKRAQRFITMLTSPTVEFAEYILRVSGAKVAPVDVRWAPVESATGVDDWTVIAAKQAAGVPVGQTLMEAGYDSEQVAKWLDEQGEAMDLGHRVDLLGKIGDAVQSIGSGVALGVVSQEEAGKIIQMVLDQATQTEDVV